MEGRPAALDVLRVDLETRLGLRIEQEPQEVERDRVERAGDQVEWRPTERVAGVDVELLDCLGVVLGERVIVRPAPRPTRASLPA